MSAIAFDNIDQFVEAFNAALEETVADAVESLHRLGESISQQERREYKTKVDRSRIDPSFTVQRGAFGRTYWIEVGPDPWEGIRVAHYEFGTSRQPPRPFMRRIVLEQASRWNPAGRG